MAASDVISSLWTGATAHRPLLAVMNTGTTTTTVTTNLRGISVVEPNIVVKTGASATIGMALAASTTGVVNSEISRDDAASSANSTPIRNPATRPTNALPPVTEAVDAMTGSSVTTCAAIALGAGSRKAGTEAATTSSCHAARTPIPSATGAPLAAVTCGPCAAPRGPR